MVKFFNESEREAIVAKIREAEMETSGEIRVHVDRMRVEDPVRYAARVFDEIGMAKTKDRNGVLIYINSSKREFAIIGDKGISAKAPDRFWERAAEGMSGAFKDARYLAGVLEAIDFIGEELRRHFPRRADDANELRDDISYK